MNVLLLPFGSIGDVHPYVALGRELKTRGHRVTVVTNDYFASLVQRAGLEFAALGTSEEYLRSGRNPAVATRRRSFIFFARHVVPQVLRRSYELIAERYVRGETVVAACALVFGARVAHEKLGVPLATVHLQPVMFRSIYASPVIPALPRLAILPRFAKPLMFALVDFAVDALLGSVNMFRAELGLPHVRRLLAHWWNSPQRVIALFPDWFGPPQPDWPPQTLLTGFPLYDAADIEPMPEGLAEFLDANTPPIVFSLGSNIQNWPQFFESAVEACRLLGRRGLLLTPYHQQVPKPLPEPIRHFEYVPYGQVLPRAAALVHHGGIGTIAQALAAGIPQLVTPFGLDQPDNAARLNRLGVALTLKPKDFRGPLVAHRLKMLLDSSDVAAQCRILAAKLRDANPWAQACTAIEQLAGQDTPVPSGRSGTGRTG